jgi:hypothetical protein
MTVTRPSSSLGVGFFVSGGKLYDANGSEFVIRGVNKVHWDNWSQGLDKAHANTVRWTIDFGRSAADNVSLLLGTSGQPVNGTIASQHVVIPGNWDGTCEEDPSYLTAIVDTWVAQMGQWSALERYMILNIANEWGPNNSTVWRDSYITAITRLRAAGWHGTISVTAGGCGQDTHSILTYGQAVFDSDPEKNVIFDQHVYGYYQDTAGGNPGDFTDLTEITTHFAALAATGLVVMIGEFGPGRAIGPSPTNVRPERVMQIAQQNGLGWLAWAWDDGSDDNWFALSYNGFYDSSADLTIAGKQVVENPTYGLAAVAHPASIFGVSRMPANYSSLVNALGPYSRVRAIESTAVSSKTSLFTDLVLAGHTVTQAGDATKQAAAAAVDAAFGGQSVVTMAPGKYYDSSLPASSWSFLSNGDPFDLFMVIKPTSSAQMPLLDTISTGPQGMSAYSVGSTLGYLVNVSSAATLLATVSDSNNPNHVVAYNVYGGAASSPNNGTLKTWISGVLSTGTDFYGPTPSVTPPVQTLRLGNGDFVFAEYVVFKRVLSDADRTVVNGYFASQYGIYAGAVVGDAAVTLPETTAAAAATFTAPASNAPIILDLTTHQAPSSIATPAGMLGSWFQFSFVPSNASNTADASEPLFAFNSTGGGGDYVLLSRTAGITTLTTSCNSAIPSGSTYVSAVLSYAAGQIITLNINPAAGTMEILGATTGNGVYTSSKPWAWPAGTLYVGTFSGGGLFPGTISDVVNQPNLAHAGTPVAFVPAPTGTGSHDLNIIRDGIKPLSSSSDPLTSFDTYNGGLSRASDWFGYTFATPQLFNKVVFREGLEFGDGGWFTSLTVQVLQSGVWNTVSSLVTTPAYPGAQNFVNFDSYSFTFAPIAGDGIRVFGPPGGTAFFTSISELEVYGSASITATVAATFSETTATSSAALGVTGTAAATFDLTTALAIGSTGTTYLGAVSALLPETTIAALGTVGTPIVATRNLALDLRQRLALPLAVNLTGPIDPSVVTGTIAGTFSATLAAAVVNVPAAITGAVSAFFSETLAAAIGGSAVPGITGTIAATFAETLMQVVSGTGRTYTIPGLTSSTSSGDNLAAITNALNNALVGDVLLIPAGDYRVSACINVDVPGVTVRGAGWANTRVLMQDQTQCSWRVFANNHALTDITLRTIGAVGRSDQDANGAGGLVLDGVTNRGGGVGCSGFLADHVVIDGPKAAGFFAYGADHYTINRVYSMNSLSDSFHNTRSCSFGKFFDCRCYNGGDDSIAFVHYNGDPASYVSHDMQVFRFQSYFGKARGFSCICTYNILVEDLYVENSLAAGIIVATETYNTSNPNQSISNCVVRKSSTGGVRLNRCNAGTADHGSVHLALDTGIGNMTGVSISDVDIIDTNYGRGSFASDAVRAVIYGSGTITATLTNFKFYGQQPSSIFGGNANPATSVITRTGWDTSHVGSPIGTSYQYALEPTGFLYP